MSIDWTAMVTAEAKAAEAAASRQRQVKAECKRRLLAVASEAAQANIVQAGIIFLGLRAEGVAAPQARAAAGMQEGDLVLAAEWRRWVDDMRAACAAIAADPAVAVEDDALWPPVPEGLPDFVGRF